MSDKLRLWPIPPRLGSGAQSPDRSAILAAPLRVLAVAAWDGAAACTRRMSATVINVITAVADTTRRFRISRLLLQLYRGGGSGPAPRPPWYAVSSLPLTKTIFCRFPT